MPRDTIEDIAKIVEDKSFWEGIQKLSELGGMMIPQANKAARMSGNNASTLQEKVVQRSQFGLMGYQMQAITGTGMAEKGLTQQCTPPLENSMMDCVNRVKAIVIENVPRVNRSEYAALPGLFRRIRSLLRVFYDYKVSETKTADLKYCDFPKNFDVGLFIQLDPSRLQAMMAEGGSDLEAFLLDEPVDVGPWRRYAYQIERDVERDEEADDDDRFNASDVHEKAGEDLAAHILIWLISDINVAFVLGEPSNEDELRWADKAMKRLVKWSTDPFYRDLLGDPLTDAMCPIYWNESLLVKFSQNGGMAALYGDWVNRSCRELCEETLAKLPDRSWENQTKKSLMAVTRELQNKINHEEPSIVKHPVYLNALFNIHSRYGLAAFQRTAKIETWQSPIIFQFLCHRIKKDCLTFRTKQDWIPLLGEFVILPDVVRRRYKWAHMSISCQWDCLTFYGCDNDSCPEQQALVRLRGKRVRGVRDPEIEERLRVWGAKSKACSKCEESSYCSQFCQKAHWPAHKPTCLESRARRSKRVIGGSPH